MAFNAENFRDRLKSDPRKWQYKTDDSAATVIADGYFDGLVSDPGSLPSVGDLIYVRVVTGLGTTSEATDYEFIVRVTASGTDNLEVQTVSDPDIPQSTFNVRDFGATGDGVTDDTSAIQAAIAAAAADFDTVYFPTGYYKISDTIALTGQISMQCEPHVLLELASSVTDRPALHYTGQSGNVYREMGVFGYPSVKAEGTTYTNTDFVAVRIQHSQGRIFQLGDIKGGRASLELFAADNQNVHECRITTGVLLEYGVAGIQLRVNATATNAWINSNVVLSQGFSAKSGETTWAYRLKREGTPNDDNLARNHFECGGFQPPSGTHWFVGLHCGQNNIFRVKHLENAGIEGIMDIIADEGVVLSNQVIQTMNQDLANFTAMLPYRYPTSDPGNIFYGNYHRSEERGNGAASWSSGDMVDQLYEHDGSGAISSMSHIFVHSTNTVAVSTNSEDGTNSEIVWHNGDEHQAWVEWDLNDWDPAIYIDTTYHKSFRLAWQSGDPTDANECRIRVEAFDEDGAEIDGSSPNGWMVQFEGSDGGSAFGWTQSGGDPRLVSEITVADDVKTVLISLRDEPELRSFSISVPPDEIYKIPLRVFKKIANDGGLPIITAAPSTFGRYQLGWTGMYEDGSTLQVCTTAGYRAKAWAASTAYTVGRLRENDTGKIYVCVTAGTSAGSGGPTGTGTGITDNTVTWDYVGAQAEFTSRTL